MPRLQRDDGRIALGLVWVGSAVPLIVYFFMVVVFTLDLVHCPPDAYECPL